MTEISCQMWIPENKTILEQDNDNAALEKAKSLFINSTVSEFGYSGGPIYLALLQYLGLSCEQGYGILGIV